MCAFYRLPTTLSNKNDATSDRLVAAKTPFALGLTASARQRLPLAPLAGPPTICLLLLPIKGSSVGGEVGERNFHQLSALGRWLGWPNL
jgi:hypothetical protein